MKKCILYTALSALVITLMGFILVFVGDKALFSGLVPALSGLFPALWYVIIPPALGLLLLIILIIVKAKRKERNPVLPLAFLVSIASFVMVAPKAYVELLDSGTPPVSLTATTGAALVVLAFALLLVLVVLDLFAKGKKKTALEEELETEEYEVVEEEPVKKEQYAPVEYLDEEVEDEDDLEEETEEEAAQRKKEAKKVKPAAAKGKEPMKPKEEKDKEYDRIYHIMKRAKDDRWIVKIAQSRKAIKIFDTQKEAIAYAEVLASNNNGVVRIFASKGANKGRIIV